MLVSSEKLAGSYKLQGSLAYDVLSRSQNDCLCKHFSCIFWLRQPVKDCLCLDNSQIQLSMSACQLTLVVKICSISFYLLGQPEFLLTLKYPVKIIFSVGLFTFSGTVPFLLWCLAGTIMCMVPSKQAYKTYKLN